VDIFSTGWHATSGHKSSAPVTPHGMYFPSTPFSSPPSILLRRTRTWLDGVRMYGERESRGPANPGLWVHNCIMIVCKETFNKQNSPRLRFGLKNNDLNFSTLVTSRWSLDTSQELSSEEERAVDGGIRVYFFCAAPRPPPSPEFNNCLLCH